MSELTNAIDELFSFLEEHPYTISRDEEDLSIDAEELCSDEISTFLKLDEAVYLLAVNKGLDRIFPKIEEMLTEQIDSLAERTIQPIEFEGHTHLPGEWINGEFHHVVRVTSCWMRSMVSLRKLADDKGKKTGGRPKKEETPGVLLVISALKTCLNDGRHGLDTPPQGKEIAEISGLKNVSRPIKKIFGSQKGLNAAWRKDDVPSILAKFEYGIQKRHFQLRDSDSVYEDSETDLD